MQVLGKVNGSKQIHLGISMPLGKGGIFWLLTQSSVASPELQLGPSLISTHSACWEHGPISSFPGWPMRSSRTLLPPEPCVMEHFMSALERGPPRDKAATMKFKQNVMLSQGGRCWVQSLFKESHAKKYMYFLGMHHTDDKMFFFFTGRQECLRPLNCTEPKPPVCKECLQIYVIHCVFVIAPVLVSSYTLPLKVYVHCFFFFPANKIKCWRAKVKK